MEQNVNQNRTRNAYKNAAAGVGSQIAATLLPFVLRTVLLKTLGDEYLGLSTLFKSLMQVLNLADIGVGAAIVFNMYKPLAENDTETVCALLNVYKKIYIAIGLIILTTGLALIPFLDALIKGEYPAGINLTVLYLMYLCDTVFSYLFMAHRVSLLSALQMNYIQENVNLLLNVLLSTVKLALLIAFKNYYIFVLFTPLLSMSTRCVVAFLSYRRFPQYRCRGRICKQQKLDITKRISGLLIQKFGNTVSTSLDSIVISGFLGLAALAVYSNYYFIMGSVCAMVRACVRATTAGLGNSIVTNDVERNLELFAELNMLNQWCLCWCVPCLLCLYQPFLHLWLGKTMTGPISLAVCMTVYFYVQQTREVISVFHDATGLWWADKWKPLVGCVVNLSLNLVCVQFLGAQGVVLSTIISYLFVEIPWETVVLFRRYFRKSTKSYCFVMLQYVGTVLLATALSYHLCSLLSDGILQLALRACIAFAIGNGLFVLLWHKRPEFTMAVDTVKRMLSKSHMQAP